MKFELPIAARYAWPLLIAALALDLIVAGAAGWILYSHANAVSVRSVEGLRCIVYAPTISGNLYIVGRCSKEPA